MKTLNRTLQMYSLAVVAVRLSACAGMTEQEKGTVVGAGVGGVIGHE